MPELFNVYHGFSYVLPWWKVEVSIAVLWEGSQDSPEQIEARSEVVAHANQIVCQAQFWLEAAEMRGSVEVDSI